MALNFLRLPQRATPQRGLSGSPAAEQRAGGGGGTSSVPATAAQHPDLVHGREAPQGHDRQRQHERLRREHLRVRREALLQPHREAEAGKPREPR